MLGLFSRPAIHEITPQEAYRLLMGDEILLVDVREGSEWSEQHVPGAVSLPLSSLAARLSELPPNKSVVFHCRSGQRSAKAIELCRRMGAPHDTHVKGGILAWQAAGLPLAA